MKFLIFNGTLKPDAESNTSKVVSMLKLAFEKLGQDCEVITMRELNYERGTVDINDELKPELMKMFKADGVVFATPIWLSGSSNAASVGVRTISAPNASSAICFSWLIFSGIVIMHL